MANQARLRLRTKTKREKGTITPWPSIHDERAAKRPLSAYLQFTVNRHASGDFKSIPVAERAKLMAQEWKALNEGEKEVSRLYLSVSGFIGSLTTVLAEIQDPST